MLKHYCSRKSNHGSVTLQANCGMQHILQHVPSITAHSLIPVTRRKSRSLSCHDKLVQVCGMLTRAGQTQFQFA